MKEALRAFCSVGGGQAALRRKVLNFGKTVPLGPDRKNHE